MANEAQAAPGKIVYDPFVGTGSLLVSCAAFGAYCAGSDFDVRVLHGTNKGKTGDVLYNFNHYKLPPPDLWAGDNSIPCLRGSGLFDSIICDPPYGVRAGARKSGRVKEIKPIAPHLLKSHIPASKPYDIEDVMDDLLDLAARILKTDGRLVYLIPTATDFDNDQLPKHPCLTLLCVSEQVLRIGFSRRCVTMVKTKEWSPELRTIRRDKTLEPEVPSYADLSASIKITKKELRKKPIGDANPLSKRQQKKLRKRTRKEAFKQKTPVKDQEK